MTIRFDQALSDSLNVVRRRLDLAKMGAIKAVLLRDLFGRIHLAFSDPPDPSLVDALQVELGTCAGPFWSGHVLTGSTMIAPQAIFDSTDLVEVGSGLWLLERTVTGAEWGRAPLQNRAPQPPRATLYGLKGGVGRSSALCAWAAHLARLGKRVLVVDLDLESPGVSSLLLPAEASPDFGVVDWFVEDAVGNADEELLLQMVAQSPVAPDATGRILVAPCSGAAAHDYLPKLARAYVDLPGPEPRPFADRLAELIDRLEESYQPDVVLLDSRAGLHDLAAIATTRLGAMTFLFAAGSRQTWDGYRILLRSWAAVPDVAREVRERVRVVAAQIPETEREPYLERLRQSSYDVFADTLYEEAGADDVDAFNFDVTASDAPHDPLKIYWSRALQDWDPATETVTVDQLKASFSDFLERATQLVLGVGEPEGEGDLG